MAAVLSLGRATLADIDEALAHLGAVPEDERGSAWHALSDKYLDHRRILTDSMSAQMGERVMRAPERR